MSRSKNRVKPLSSLDELSNHPPRFGQVDKQNTELQMRNTGPVDAKINNLMAPEAPQRTRTGSRGANSTDRQENHRLTDEDGENRTGDKDDMLMRFDSISGKNIARGFADIENNILVEDKQQWIDTQRYSLQDDQNTSMSLMSDGNIHLINRKDSRRKTFINQKEVKLYKQQIRQAVQDEKNNKFFDGDEETPASATIRDKIKNIHSSNQRKKTYLQNYGYKFSIPTLYILEAKTFERDINYVFRISRYVVPTEQNMNVYTHQITGKNEKSTFNELFQDTIGNLSLELLYRGDAYPETKQKLIVPGATWGKQVFSDDHMLYALLVPTKKKIPNTENIEEERTVHKIYVVQLRNNNEGTPDPLSLIEKIQDDEGKFIDEKSKNFLVTFTDVHLKYDLSFTKYMRFENNKRYLSCVGDQKLFVFDIQKQKGSFYEVPEQIIEKILDTKFTSNYDKDTQKFKTIKCMVACKRVGFNQIYIYDLFEREMNVDPVQKEQDLYIQQQRGVQKLYIMPNQKVFNYLEPATEHQLVKFSRDGKSIMYADINEKFIIQSLYKGQVIKRKLNQLEDKVVYLITPDPDPQGEGFYVMCSQEYDKYVRIVHSHRFDLDEKLKIIRLIEPGLLKSFEMFIKVMRKYNVSELESKNNIYQTKNVIQLIQVRDQYFTIDQMQYIETKQIVQHSDEQIGAQDQLLSLALQQVKIVENKKTVRNDIQKQHYHQSSITFQKAEKCEVSAFSVNWPYIAFSGSQDYLIILNAFEQEMIHRVQIFDEKQDIDICQTYITDTNDLFCMVYENKKYYLFMIDLDATNLQENETEDLNLNSCYKIGDPILIYDEKLVGCNPVQKIHVRGSSRKEPLDSGNNCICLFLHGFQVYIWIQNDPRVQGTSVTLALKDPISSFSWYTENDSCIYLMQDDHKMSDIMIKGELGTVPKKSRVPDQANEDDSNFTQDIKKVEIKFSTVEISTVYQEASMSDTVMAFCYDRMAQKIIMILKADLQSQKMDNVLYSFKIFSLVSKKVELSIEITNPMLIGRLLSGLYTIVDGHMYFNNNVIKIRYDLIASAFSYRYNESDFFDYYFDIFQLNQGMDMLSNTPLDSRRAHRLAYIKQDRNCAQPYRIIFLPYLNERRVYLNNIHKGSDYFYTSIEVQQEDINSHTLELVKMCDVEEKKFEERLMGRRNTVRPGIEFKRKQSQIFKIAPGVQVQQSVKMRLLNDYYKGEKLGTNNIMSIISMKLNTFKYRVFSQNGILMNQVNFRKQVQNYGQPMAVSPDGLNYLFKKTDDELEILRSQGKLTEEQQIKYYFTFSVMSLTLFGMCHIKDIDVMQGLQNYYITPNPNHSHKSFAQFMRKYDWIFQDDIDKIQSQCYMVAKINDNADVCIQLKSIPSNRRPANSYENQFEPEKKDSFIPFMQAHKMDYDVRKSYDIERGSLRICESQILYYYESLAHNINLPNIQQKNGLRISNSLLNKINELVTESQEEKKLTHQVMATQGFFEEDFELNDKYLFIREFDRASFLDMSEPIYQEDTLQIKKINLKVDVQQGCGTTNNYIKDIRTGKNSNEIAIIVGMIEGTTNNVIMWDIEKNNEIMLYEVNDPYQIIWDHKGQMYILEADKVIDAAQNCAIKAFSFQDLAHLDKDVCRFSQMYHKGIRLDGNDQNWLILRQYLSIPFCYMTFVIQSHIEKNGFKEFRAANKFDPEGYNYIMNRSNTFFDSKFVTDDCDHLQDVLLNFSKVDPELMELMNYTVPFTTHRESDGELLYLRRSALSCALAEGNYKNVSLILSQMARYPRQNLCHFSYLFKDLTDYASFQSFLTRMMFQTQVMESKQILRVHEKFSKKIVSVCGCLSSFVDNQIFEQDLGQLHKNQRGGKTFPVKIQALQVGWIFDKEYEENALEFFDALLDTPNLDYFKLKGLQLLIEFLYQNFQSFLSKIVFPPFMIFSTALMYYIYLNEEYRSRFLRLQDVDNSGEQMIEHTDESMRIRPWFRVYNQFWLLICLLYIGLQIFKMKIETIPQYLKDPAEVTDICLGLLGFIVYVLVQVEQGQFSNDHWVENAGPDVKQFERLTMEHYRHDVIAQRIIFVVMAQLFVFKLFWFMKHMSEKFDILMEIIITIFYDIFHLVIIMLIWAGVSCVSFFLLGRNQLDFDEVSEQDQEKISYATGIGSFFYVYGMLLGEGNYEAFEVGKSSQFTALTILFCITTFIIMIHLLNMLIAVMGNTFNERAAIANELFYKNQLRFVRTQWHLINLNFQQLRNVKYLIAASHEEIEHLDEDHEFEECMVQKIDNQDSQLQILLQGQSKSLMRTKKIEQSAQNGLELQMMQINMRE